jgi:hypothetical protein
MKTPRLGLRTKTTSSVWIWYGKSVWNGVWTSKLLGMPPIVCYHRSVSVAESFGTDSNALHPDLS